MTDAPSFDSLLTFLKDNEKAYRQLFEELPVEYANLSIISTLFENGDLNQELIADLSLVWLFSDNSVFNSLYTSYPKETQLFLKQILSTTSLGENWKNVHHRFGIILFRLTAEQKVAFHDIYQPWLRHEGLAEYALWSLQEILPLLVPKDRLAWLKLILTPKITNELIGRISSIDIDWYVARQDRSIVYDLVDRTGSQPLSIIDFLVQQHPEQCLQLALATLKLVSYIKSSNSPTLPPYDASEWWRHSIEESSQTEHADEIEDILVTIARESLAALYSSNLQSWKRFFLSLADGLWSIERRLAINALREVGSGNETELLKTWVMVWTNAFTEGNCHALHHELWLLFWERHQDLVELAGGEHTLINKLLYSFERATMKEFDEISRSSISREEYVSIHLRSWLAAFAPVLESQSLTRWHEKLVSARKAHGMEDESIRFPIYSSSVSQVEYISDETSEELIRRLKVEGPELFVDYIRMLPNERYTSKRSSRNIILVDNSIPIRELAARWPEELQKIFSAVNAVDIPSAFVSAMCLGLEDSARTLRDHSNQLKEGDDSTTNNILEACFSALRLKRLWADQSAPDCFLDLLDALDVLASIIHLEHTGAKWLDAIQEVMQCSWQIEPYSYPRQSGYKQGIKYEKDYEFSFGSYLRAHGYDHPIDSLVTFAGRLHNELLTVDKGNSSSVLFSMFEKSRKLIADLIPTASLLPNVDHLAEYLGLDFMNLAIVAHGSPALTSAVDSMLDRVLESPVVDSSATERDGQTLFAQFFRYGFIQGGGPHSDYLEKILMLYELCMSEDSKETSVEEFSELIGAHLARLWFSRNDFQSCNKFILNVLERDDQYRKYYAELFRGMTRRKLPVSNEAWQHDFVELFEVARTLLGESHPSFSGCLSWISAVPSEISFGQVFGIFNVALKAITSAVYVEAEFGDFARELMDRIMESKTVDESQLRLLLATLERLELYQVELKQSFRINSWDYADLPKIIQRAIVECAPMDSAEGREFEGTVSILTRIGTMFGLVP